MGSKKTCSLKVFDGQKTLYGTAAQIYKISKEGGWDKYHEQLVERITRKVTNEVMEELNRPIIKSV